MKPGILACVLCLMLPNLAMADGKSFGLSAPDALVDSGFLKHLLPRFSLKTGVRIRLNDGTAGAAFGDEGTPVFRDDTTVWHLDGAGSHIDTFAKWLQSDVGKRTIEAFEKDGAPLFSADVGAAQVVATAQMAGDTAKGEALSLAMCGRCHVVNASNRMNAIGSTPSFALMRTFGDWQARFEGFYVLRPHPAFTQVADVTDPFDETLPSPIVPLEITLDEIAAIVAYVSEIEPADLGAPIQSQ